MNFVDRVIAAVAPSAALRRVRARAALDVLERGYEGAARGRRTQGWLTHPTSANAEAGKALTLLRDRARDLVRNNPYAERAGVVWVGNVVGGGIVPRADEAHVDLFKQWSEECDADGRCDFFGLQALVARTEWEAGECLVRFRPRRMADGLPVPLQLQVLEPDHLDTAKTGDTKAGGVVIQGVEFDGLGRRVAYWLFPTHPGDAIPFARRSFTSKRVPAAAVLHIYRLRRPGQVRGVSQLASSLLRLRDLDEYEDAELLRKKIEACFAAFVTQGEEPSVNPVVDATRRKDGQLVETLEPGIIKYLKMGQDVKFGQPSSSAGYAEHIRMQLHAVAAGIGVTYQQLTGDLSQANYSSMRGGLLEFRRPLGQFQRQVMIHQFCRPVWGRVQGAAFLAGAIRTEVTAEWIPPRHEAVDPLKDAMADTMLVRAGFETLFDEIARHGGDPVRRISEMQEIAEALDEAGLVLDTDPRKTSRGGLTQARAKGTVIPSPDMDDTEE
jgi:lambda family phage portal protein